MPPRGSPHPRLRPHQPGSRALLGPGPIGEIHHEFLLPTVKDPDDSAGGFAPCPIPSMFRDGGRGPTPNRSETKGDEVPVSFPNPIGGCDRRAHCRTAASRWSDGPDLAVETGRSDRSRPNAVGAEQRGVPGDRRAPVVAHDHPALGCRSVVYGHATAPTVRGQPHSDFICSGLPALFESLG